MRTQSPNAKTIGDREIAGRGAKAPRHVFHREVTGREGGPHDHLKKENMMDVPEPRVRRRGMFVHAETPELDHIEQEGTEGVSIRLRVSRPRAERAIVGSRKPTHAVRTASLNNSSAAAEVRFESGTGSHRQVRMSR